MSLHSVVVIFRLLLVYCEKNINKSACSKAVGGGSGGCNVFSAAVINFVQEILIHSVPFPSPLLFLLGHLEPAAYPNLEKSFLSVAIAVYCCVTV